jgi:hypothetical protein
MVKAKNTAKIIKPIRINEYMLMYIVLPPFPLAKLCMAQAGIYIID